MCWLVAESNESPKPGVWVLIVVYYEEIDLQNDVTQHFFPHFFAIFDEYPNSICV